MSTSTKGRFRSTAISIATTLLLGSAAAFGQVPLPAGPAAPSAPLVRVGPPTGEVEKDSFGLAAPQVPVCLAPRFSERPQAVGPVMGNPEKDNFGLVVVGMEPCSPADQR
jgi:hypothetical protein